MGEKYTAVGSSIYNLAGPTSQREDYLKSLIIGGISMHADSLADVINRGYRNGPARRVRSFLQWARQDAGFLDQFGVTSGTLLIKNPVQYSVVKLQLADQVDPWQDVQILSAKPGDTDINYWVLRYLAETRAGVIPAYSYKYDSSTGVITIEFEAGGNPETVTPTDYFNGTKYLYVNYQPVDKNKLIGMPAPEPVITLGASESFPTVDGWTQISLIESNYEYDLNTSEEADLTYSDNRTPVHVPLAVLSTKEDVVVVGSIGDYSKDELTGPLPDNPNSKTALRTIQTQTLAYEIEEVQRVIITTRVIEGGVVETRTATRTQERLVAVRTIHQTTQTLVLWAWLPQRWYLYAQGSGKPDLDMYFAGSVMSTTSKYYPPIPLRFENSAVTDKTGRWFVDLDLDWWWDRDELWIAPFGRSDLAIRIAGSDPIGHTEDWSVVNYSFTAYDPEETDDLNKIMTAKSWPVFQMRGPHVGGTYPADGSWKQVLAKPEPDFGSKADLRHLYPSCVKAFKKAFGAKFDKVQTQILDNPDVDDIDYAYAVFGVQLNVKDMHCRKYIYKFLQTLMNTIGYPGEEEEWLGDCQRAQENRDQNLEGETMMVDPDPPYKTLEIKSDHPGVINYKSELKWAFITEEFGTGKLQRPIEKVISDRWSVVIGAYVLEQIDQFNTILESPAPVFQMRGPHVDTTYGWLPLFGTPTRVDTNYWKVTFDIEWWWDTDELWIAPDMQHLDQAVRVAWIYDDEFVAAHEDPTMLDAKGGDVWWDVDIDPGMFHWDQGDKVALCWQKTSNSWSRLVVSDLRFVNYVYQDHTIERRANVQAKKEAESDFIFPLQDDVLKSLNVIDQTQVAMSCCLLVFNCYTVVQKEWYEEDWFKVVVIVVIVIIAVLLAYYTGGTSLGLLGTAVEVGAALGLAGTTAVIVGALINAVVGLVLSQLIGMLVSTMLRDAGPEGKIIGAIISMVLSLVLGSGGDLGSIWNTISSAEGLMSLASLATTGISVALEEQAKNLAKESAALWERNGERIAELARLYEEQFGRGQLNLELARQFVDELKERPDQFLKRTLMTGSDIVDATLNLIPNYVEYNLRLDLPE